MSNRLEVGTFWVGDNPYAGIAYLKGVTVGEERTFRQIKARKERVERSKEEEDVVEQGEERKREMKRDQMRQEKLKGELLRTELTEVRYYACHLRDPG